MKNSVKNARTNMSFTLERQFLFTNILIFFVMYDIVMYRPYMFTICPGISTSLDIELAKGRTHKHVNVSVMEFFFITFFPFSRPYAQVLLQNIITTKVNKLLKSVNSHNKSVVGSLYYATLCTT